MSANVYNLISTTSAKGKKQLALLIDPDKFDSDQIIKTAESVGVDYYFVGGSLITSGNFENCIQQIKKIATAPVIIFPGNNMQISADADAILLLSLISGRNADLLIGQHVTAAPAIKASGLESIATGYMLVDSGQPTAVSYISNTAPIPYNKPEIAACTAMAGEMLGLKLIYLETGSGAQKPVSAAMIAQVKRSIQIPLIIGGGIRNHQDALAACEAGADVIVVGTIAEQQPEMLKEISKVIHTFNPAIAVKK